LQGGQTRGLRHRISKVRLSRKSEHFASRHPTLNSPPAGRKWHSFACNTITDQERDADAATFRSSAQSSAATRLVCLTAGGARESKADAGELSIIDSVWFDHRLTGNLALLGHAGGATASNSRSTKSMPMAVSPARSSL